VLVLAAARHHRRLHPHQSTYCDLYQKLPMYQSRRLCDATTHILPFTAFSKTRRAGLFVWPSVVYLSVSIESLVSNTSQSEQSRCIRSARLCRNRCRRVARAGGAVGARGRLRLRAARLRLDWRCACRSPAMVAADMADAVYYRPGPPGCCGAAGPPPSDTVWYFRYSCSNSRCISKSACRSRLTRCCS
jgi:hypothetical protein